MYTEFIGVFNMIIILLHVYYSRCHDGVLLKLKFTITKKKIRFDLL